MLYQNMKRLVTVHTIWSQTVIFIYNSAFMIHHYLRSVFGYHTGMIQKTIKTKRKYCLNNSFEIFDVVLFLSVVPTALPFAKWDNIAIGEPTQIQLFRFFSTLHMLHFDKLWCHITIQMCIVYCYLKISILFWIYILNEMTYPHSVVIE